MLNTKYLIVGAGVTGLAFADWIAGEDYLICEADEEIGGFCKTIHKSGFTWDYSGHFFHFKHPEIESYLLGRMGNEEVVRVRRKSKVFWKSMWIDFPFQKNIHQLPKEDLIDCIYDLHFRSEIQPVNFKDMLYSKFGAGIADRFLIPYNEKLYATDLTSLDMNAMGRFFPYAEVSQIIRNFKHADNSSYNDTFTYPKGGAIQYINALVKTVPRERILVGERLIKIDLASKVARTSRELIKYETLVSSAPMYDIIRCTDLDAAEDVFSWSNVLVFNLGFDRKGISDLHWAYFPQSEIVFYRVGVYDNIVPGDRMSLYVEIGLHKDVFLTELDVERYRTRVISDLRRIGVVTSHQLVDWHHVLMKPAYVHISERSMAEAVRIKQELSKRGIFSIGRYGGWTYCSIEDNIVEARRLAEHLRLGQQKESRAMLTETSVSR